MAGEGEFSIDDWKDHLDISAIGTNSIQGVEGISEEKIILKEGENFDFLKYTDHYCIVSQSCMEERQWEIGDVVSLNLFYYFHKNEYSLKIEPLDLVSFEIIGSMENAAYDDSGYLPTEIILPVEAVREVYHSREIPFSADSAFFYLQDPLKLNGFKAQMKEFHLLPQSTSARDNDKGEALYVKDSVFIAAADRLRLGMGTLLSFLPMVLGIVIFVGYITSYLLVYNRKKDFSIMQSIGFRHKEAFMIFLLEQLMLAFCASLIQSILSIVFITRNGSILFVVNLGFLICFMMGVTIAVWRIGNSNIMEALSQNE
jgi:ABC-type antimicrobial peptide transport system permease subunit